MTDSDKKMNPDTSPSMMPATGVKRVNNVPLLMGIGVALLFASVIVMVAFKRAHQEAGVVEEKVMAPHRDNQKIVADIIGKHQKGGIVHAGGMEDVKAVSVNQDAEAPIPLIEQVASPPVLRPMPEELMLEKPLDSEMDNIRRAKIQAFEEAVKARMHIPMPDSQANTAMQPGSPNIASEQQRIAQQLEAMKSADMDASYEARLQQIKAMMLSGAQDRGNAEKTSKQSDPFRLLETRENRWELQSSMEAPKTHFTLRAGSIIPGVMISGVNPKFPGQIIGQVASSVYDTATGKYTLIPQGTRLIGTYASDVGYAQEAVLIVWQRLVFPDGKAFDLGTMPGADSAGVAGFKDEVNNHYLKTFGSALLMTGIVGGIAYSQQVNNSPFNTQPTAGSVLSEALGQQLGQVSAQMLMKNLNVAPDLHIRTGYQFNVMVTKDMVFGKPYQSFDYRSR